MPEASFTPGHLDYHEVNDHCEHTIELAQTVKVMNRLRAAEIFATPVHSKEFLDSLEYEEFKKYISYVNGVVRQIPAPARGQVSGSVVSAEGDLFGTSIEYRPPHKNVRDRLLEIAFEKSQTIDNPEMAALTLGLSLNAIHYFSDGNGRTARLAYALLAKGYDGSEEDQEYYSQLLENTAGREIINLNPAISGIDKKIRLEMSASIAEKRGYMEAAFGGAIPTYIHGGFNDAMEGETTVRDLAVAANIDEQGRNRLYRTMESGGMSMTALMLAFKPERVKEYVNVSSDGARVFIDGDSFIPTLSNDEIKTWWTKSEDSIVHYVLRVINVSDRPDAASIAGFYRPNH